MTKRLSPARKAARRRLREYIHVLGGKRLSAHERADVVAQFIKRMVMDIDAAFPGKLEPKSILAIGALLEVRSSTFPFEELAVKLAELRERLYTERQVPSGGIAATIH